MAHQRIALSPLVVETRPKASAPLNVPLHTASDGQSDPEESADMLDQVTRSGSGNRGEDGPAVSPSVSHITLSSDSDDDGGDDNARSDEALSDSDSSSSISIQSYASSTPEPSPQRRPTIKSRPRRTTTSSKDVLPPASPTLGIPYSQVDPRTLPPDHPLPRPTFDFDILNYAPHRNPSKPARWIPPEERELGEEFDRLEAKKVEEKTKRLREQKVTREAWEGEKKWGREWKRVAWQKRELPKDEQKYQASSTLHSAAFFPYPQLEGLEWLDGVFVTVGDGYINFYRCPSTSTSTAAPDLIQRVATLSPTKKGDPNQEEYLTCAWSVNTTTWPFTPMLAVAGVGRVIELYLIGRRERIENGKRSEEVVVHLDRTITGHGHTIYQLAFHPQRPHLLLSCSEDRTIRLWDPTLPWGSNLEVQKVVKQEMAAREAGRTAKTAGKKMRGGKRERFDPLRASRLWLRMRPRVDGELVAMLTGHERAVFTADFHSIYPLIVSGGADGRIRLWQLPPSIFDATPTWPTPPNLYQHPLPPSSLIHPPVIEPFFSTIHLHPGQWPTQVSFLDSTIPTILSIAPLTHPQASTIPRTSIKISTIDCLSTLPNKSFDSHLASHHLSISQAKRTSKDGRIAPEVIPLKPRLAIEEPDDLGLRIEKEIVLEGMNCCVGDQVGISRRGPFRLSTNIGGGGGEQFFVVPTTLDDSEETLEDEKDAAGLYLFRPFTAPSSTADSHETTTSTNGNGTTKLNGIDSSKKDRVSKVFPEDRERSIFDYHTRLRPSSMIKYRPSCEDAGEVRREEESDEEGLIHFRCVAVSPGRGEWVVAVGDGGRLALWKEENVSKA
ncbi:hypothetical protein JCM5350_006795 [Sporobolomyces pararoseus]